MTRPDRSYSAGIHPAAGEALTPAPQMIVPASIHSPAIRTRPGATSSTALPVQTVTPSRSSRSCA